MSRRSTGSRGSDLIWLVTGAGLMYFLDPQLGRTRRAKVTDQIAGLLRRGGEEVQRKAEYTKGQIEGLQHLAQSEDQPENDAVLTAKVESEVLRRDEFPKGNISVNAVGGVVELRGTCESQDQIDALEQEVRKVTGVLDVTNLLHLPGTPAPNKQEVRDI